MKPFPSCVVVNTGSVVGSSVVVVVSFSMRTVLSLEISEVLITGRCVTNSSVVVAGSATVVRAYVVPFVVTLSDVSIIAIVVVSMSVVDVVLGCVVVVVVAFVVKVVVVGAAVVIIFSGSKKFMNTYTSNNNSYKYTCLNVSSQTSMRNQMAEAGDSHKMPCGRLL